MEPRSAWTGSYNRLSMFFNLILLLCQRLTNFDMVTLPTVDKHAHLGELQSKFGRNAISKVHYDIVCFLCWWTMRISKCEFDGVQNCLHRKCDEKQSCCSFNCSSLDLISLACRQLLHTNLRKASSGFYGRLSILQNIRSSFCTILRH